jgi:hypothetical protein
VPNPRPVVVFGNQKSGTTAIAAFLGRLSGASVALDMEREWRAPSYQHVASGEMTMGAFRHRNRLELSRAIVKEPNLLTIWPQFLAAVPEARCLLVVRDPRDNLRSILDRLGLPGDREELTPAQRGANGPGWALYLDGSWLGLKPGNYIETMARRWNLGYRFLTANRERTLLVRYEDFLRDKEGVIARAAAGVGLPARYPLGAEADRQYQPKGTGNRDWRAVFGDSNLGRIERICAEGMEALGYEPTA